MNFSRSATLPSTISLATVARTLLLCVLPACGVSHTGSVTSVSVASSSGATRIPSSPDNLAFEPMTAGVECERGNCGFSAEGAHLYSDFDVEGLVTALVTSTNEASPFAIILRPPDGWENDSPFESGGPASAEQWCMYGFGCHAEVWRASNGVSEKVLDVDGTDPNLTLLGATARAGFVLTTGALFVLPRVARSAAIPIAFRTPLSREPYGHRHISSLNDGTVLLTVHGEGGLTLYRIDPNEPSMRVVAEASEGEASRAFEGTPYVVVLDRSERRCLIGRAPDFVLTGRVCTVRDVDSMWMSSGDLLVWLEAGTRLVASRLSTHEDPVIISEDVRSKGHVEIRDSVFRFATNVRGRLDWTLSDRRLERGWEVFREMENNDGPTANPLGYRGEVHELRNGQSRSLGCFDTSPAHPHTPFPLDLPPSELVVPCHVMDDIARWLETRPAVTLPACPSLDEMYRYCTAAIEHGSHQDFAQCVVPATGSGIDMTALDLVLRRFEMIQAIELNERLEEPVVVEKNENSVRFRIGEYESTMRFVRRGCGYELSPTL